MPTIEKDIEKEMKEYPVLTFADILIALKSHPDWLEELRKIILTTELLELPRKFEELLKRVDKIEKDVEILKQDVAVLKQDVAVLKKDMAYLKGEFGRFKGKDYERTIRERYYAYFGKILRSSKLVQFEEIIPILDDAEEKGLITEEQRDSVLNLDILVKGQIKSTQKQVILGIEVSYSLHEDDIERAIERAQILAHVLHEEVIPTVVTAEVKEDLEKLADEKGVFLIKASY
jgi:hypothetical protein